MNINPQEHAASVNRTLSPPEDLARMEEGPSVPFEQPQDSEGEEEISEVETDIIFQAESLAMEQDEEPEDQNEDLGEDSEIDGDESDYIPNDVRGSHRHAGVSHKCAGASNLSETFMHKQGTKDTCEGGNRKKKNLTYKFCPLPHRPSILHLLTKHFCQHPLLPEWHGQHQTAEYLHCNSVYEMYLYCKNNHLWEVWGYLWMNWYTPDKWKLWAQSAHPHAIPQKRTTMVVKAMW